MTCKALRYRTSLENIGWGPESRRKNQEEKLRTDLALFDEASTSSVRSKLVERSVNIYVTSVPPRKMSIESFFTPEEKTQLGIQEEIDSNEVALSKSFTQLKLNLQTELEALAWIFQQLDSEALQFFEENFGEMKFEQINKLVAKYKLTPSELKIEFEALARMMNIAAGEGVSKIQAKAAFEFQYGDFIFDQLENFKAEFGYNPSIIEKNPNIVKEFVTKEFIELSWEINEFIYCKNTENFSIEAYDNLYRLPANISLIRNLKDLKILNTHIQSLPTGLREMEHLQKLDVRSNLLRHLPEFLKEIKSLQEVDARYNSIRMESRKSFENAHFELVELKPLEQDEYHALVQSLKSFAV